MQSNLATTPSKRSTPQPFFEQLQQEMERLFDRFRGYPTITTALPDNGFGSWLSPAIDITETPNTLEVTADIPGVAADDLDVSLNGDLLVIKGEKSETHKTDEADYHLHERSYGSFHRQIPLNFTPKDDAIDAKFKDGVLKLTITKPPEAKTANRKISIKAN